MELIDLLSDERVLYYGFEGHIKPELSRLKHEFLKVIHQVNPNVVQLGRHTSGIICSFETDAIELTFDVSLMRPSVMRHMTMLAESGFDLYLGFGKHQQFYQSFGPETGKSDYQHTVSFNERKLRHIILYFPLYNGINRFMVQIQDAFFGSKPLALQKKNSHLWHFYHTRSLCIQTWVIAFVLVVQSSQR